MKTLEAEARSIIIDFPETWDEMTPENVHYCLKQAVKMLAGKISADMFKLRCFYKIAQIKRNWRTVLWEKTVSEETLLRKNANAWQLADMLTDFMFKVPENNEKPEFSFEALTNFFPKIKIKGVEFYGPDTLLADITFCEFRTAIDELNSYFETKDEHQLSLLFAVLYRPAKENIKEWQQQPDFDGRIKEPFNRHHQERYAKMLDKLPPYQRMAMLLHFTWCIHWIKTEEVEIEGKNISFSPLFPKPKENSKSKPSTGWTGVLFGIAEKGIFGDIKKADDASFYDVLLLLYDNYLQAEEIKRNSRSTTK